MENQGTQAEELKFVSDKLKLGTYTRRIRHLHALTLKNLSYKPKDVSQLKVFFTLHRDPETEEFYQSETLTGTLHPLWESFDLTCLPYWHLSSSHVVIRVWVSEPDLQPLVHIEYDLDLQKLVYIKPWKSVDSEAVRMPNSISFGMFDATFDLPGNGLSAPNALFLRASYNGVKRSYPLNLLSRLQIVLRALKQTEACVESVRLDIQRRLAEIKSTTDKKEKVESSSLRINKLKARLAQSQLTLTKKRSKLYTRKAATTKLEKDIDAFHIEMRDLDTHYTNLHSDFDNNRERLLKSNVLLFKRERQMVYELSCIYSIEEMASGKGQYLIAGVHLPNSESFSGHSDIEVSTSLGHCAHLVNMLATFLDVPLQYPIEYRGSRSLIYDMIIESPATNKDRSFPLYSKGKEKHLFRYAVFLLNKDIAQLRYSYGLPTKDLRLTLKNLKEFIENKFGVGLLTAKSLKPEVLPAPNGLERAVSISTIHSVSRVSNAIDQQGSLVETPPDGLILHDPAITRLKATPMDDADLRCMSPQYNSSANIYNNKSSEDDQQTDDELKITSDQTFGENLARNQSPDSSNGQIDHLETTKNSIPARTLI